MLIDVSHTVGQCRSTPVTPETKPLAACLAAQVGSKLGEELLYMTQGTHLMVSSAVVEQEMLARLQVFHCTSVCQHVRSPPHLRPSLQAQGRAFVFECHEALAVRNIPVPVEDKVVHPRPVGHHDVAVYGCEHLQTLQQGIVAQPHPGIDHTAIRDLALAKVLSAHVGMGHPLMLVSPGNHQPPIECRMVSRRTQVVLRRDAAVPHMILRNERHLGTQYKKQNKKRK